MMRDYPKTKILIDDYLNRPEYKIIEKYAKFIGINEELFLQFQKYLIRKHTALKIIIQIGYSIT